MIINQSHDGITPHIGSNGNWFFNTTDTGVRAKGQSNTEIVEVILLVTDWSPDTLSQTVSCQGVLADEAKQMITIIPAHVYKDLYKGYGIECVGFSSNTLEFKTNIIPTENITVYVALDAIGDTKPTNIYSLEEQVVGTWIDGRPIYRQTFVSTLPSSTGEIVVGCLNEDVEIDKIINFSSIVYQSNGSYITAPNNTSTLFFNSYTNSFGIYMNNSDMKNAQITGYIEYTKTTDTATIEI